MADEISGDETMGKMSLLFNTVNFSVLSKIGDTRGEAVFFGGVFGIKDVGARQRGGKYFRPIRNATTFQPIKLMCPLLHWSFTSHTSTIHRYVKHPTIPLRVVFDIQ